MGHDVVDDYAAARRALGIVPQELVFDPFFNVRETLRIQSGYFGVRRNDAWIDELLAALGLADRGDARADRLSGGERQKVALARLQLQRPRLLLSDEPTSALDPAATREVCHALCAVAAAPGRTLLTVLHDLELLPILATRVIGMAGGRVRWDRPLSEVTPPLLQALYERQAADLAPATPSEPAPVIRLASA
jgi:ABC-type multidrug transport system ATPase subunit